MLCYKNLLLLSMDELEIESNWAWITGTLNCYYWIVIEMSLGIIIL